MPLVRPICWSSSGCGSVMIMSLETIATLRSNCGKARAIQAFRANTTRPARTEPEAVSTTACGPSCKPVMAVPS
ncbi:hypothetical protein D3C81_1430690 [compost metagenome]